MAEEPQPSNPGPAPSAAERQREEAALSNLSSQNMSADDTEGGPPTATDTAALGAAVSNLSIGGSDEPGKGSAGGAADAKAGGGKGAAGAGAALKEEAKKVKIDQGDVTFLVQELEVSKKRAGEMLQAAGGDRAAAVRTFVTPVKI